MGRIKTMLIKRMSNELVEEHRSELKKDFVENKKLVDKFLNVRSKKIRNIISGYVTRIMKSDK